MIAAPWQPLLRKAARAYLAGPELADAVRLAHSLAAQGLPASTLCFWDAPGDPPRQVAAMYTAAIGAIAGERLQSYISIKAPSIMFDERMVLEIADAARAAGGIRVHFDSLGPETADRTMRLLDCAAAQGGPLGCTVPGRWRRSPGDAARLAAMGVTIRVVKGQWPDLAGDLEPHQGFLNVIDSLAGQSQPVAVATHHPDLAAAAIRKLQAAGTPCEMELLYGLPSRAALQVSRDLGVPVRFYLPYGHAWLPYALRQAGRDPRILWWLLRDASRN
ncbi:MAG: proline dehydrogenase [Bryobacteraceae bacterium]|jgi:proline dehydrogenase